jgi:hypothetical protein
MGKSFSEMEREWENIQERLPGGPGDPALDYDDYDYSDDGEGMTQAKFERKLEYADLRHKEQREDELMRDIQRRSSKESSKSFRDNFDPRVDGPWNYEGHNNK